MHHTRVYILIIEGADAGMNKKWLLNEIELWRNENIINTESAEILKTRYSGKTNANTLTIIFSILGSLLIGTGIILILAKNWYFMPTTLKVILSVLPLITGQGLAVFTVLKKYDSLAVREGVAIFYTAGVFSSLAMISQSFHLAYDFEAYILACGLLVLPIIYILDAVSPLAVYFYAIINWGGVAATQSSQLLYAACLLLFFGLGLLYVILHRKNPKDIRHIYTIWVSVIAGFALITVIAVLMNLDQLDFYILYLTYFAFLFAFDKNRDGPLLPYKLFGVLGGLAIMMIMSFSWEGYYFFASDNIIIAVVPIAGILLLGVRNYKEDLQKLLFLSALLLFALILIISSYTGGGYFVAIAANLIAGAIGVGFILTGAREADLPITNLGMLVTCGLILMRFFDENIDFLYRGVAFLVLGGLFLLINFRMMKKRKSAQKDKEVKLN